MLSLPGPTRLPAESSDRHGRFGRYGPLAEAGTVDSEANEGDTSVRLVVRPIISFLVLIMP
jgi:hypothetical protein